MIRLGSVLLALVLASQARGGYIDTINPNAATLPNTDFTPALKDIGWYYTPTASYYLAGIYSQFAAIGAAGTGARTMTVQIQTDRPAAGGTILGQGSFTADSAIGGTLGSNFAPVLLTAGTTYFVDLLNVGGMSLDIGQWTTVGGVHVATGGATTRLGGYYEDVATDTSFSTPRLGDMADQTLPTGNASGAEPILLFSGTPFVSVPEPSSIVMLTLGLGGVGMYRHRRTRAMAGLPASNG